MGKYYFEKCLNIDSVYCVRGGFICLVDALAYIAMVYSEIMVLRQQLKLAQQKMQDSLWASEDINRATEWLDEKSIIFSEYDDVVVRRLVDTIIVNSEEGTITVYLKGGVEITEPIYESQT